MTDSVGLGVMSETFGSCVGVAVGAGAGVSVSVSEGMGAFSSALVRNEMLLART